MSEAFGAGIALDEDFDFSVNETGDLKTVSGRAELEKDLSFQLSFFLRRHIGELVSENLKAEVKNTAKEIVELDTRVREFREANSTVTFPDRSSNTISITVPIIPENVDTNTDTSGGSNPFEFVVEVSD
jgi:hypothetical protein